MRLLRRAWNTRILTDYRQAAQAVTEKRKARLLSEPASVETPKPSETYRPRQRLQNVRVRVDELVDTSLSIPRTWEPDIPDVPAPSLKALIRVNRLIPVAAVVAGLGLFVVRELGAKPDRLFVLGSIAYSLLTAAASAGLVFLSKPLEFNSPFCFLAARVTAVFGFIASFVSGIGVLTFALWFAYIRCIS
jgi:hypothetical protein